MGDLARRRSARDLWISRSHLGALALGVGIVAATAFLLGLSIGQTRGAQQQGDTHAFVSASPDGGLVELLARVEASADPLGGIGELTFPEALSKVPDPIVQVGPPLPGALPVAAPDVAPPPAPADPPAVVEVAAGPLAIAPISDPRPEGRFSVRIRRFEGSHGAAPAAELRSSLRAEGKPAFLVVELVKGVPRYDVDVGGYAEQAEAEAAAVELKGKAVPLR